MNYEKWLFKHIIYGYVFALWNFIVSAIFFVLVSSWLDFAAGISFALYTVYVVLENGVNVRRYRELTRGENA